MELAQQTPQATMGNPPSLPRLYSRFAIQLCAVLFSTLYGSALFALNCYWVGSRRGIWAVLIFGVLYTVLIGSITHRMGLEYQGIVAAILNGIGATVMNTYFWNQFITPNLTSPEAFVKRQAWKPALLPLIVIIPMMVYFYNHPEVLGAMLKANGMQ